MNLELLEVFIAVVTVFTSVAGIAVAGGILKEISCRGKDTDE